MKLKWKSILIGIFLGIVTAIVIDTYFLSSYKIARDIDKAELRNLQHEFDMLQIESDSLSNLVQTYQRKNDSLVDVILIREVQYKKLKDETGQKVDFVHDLPLDMAIEYFTEQVSKEGSLGW